MASTIPSINASRLGCVSDEIAARKTAGSLLHGGRMKRLLPLFCLLLCTCTPAQLAGLQTANTIANGVACGMAAANGTPCTPQAVLDALARDAAAQKEKVSAVAPQAAAVDPQLTERLLAQLEANTESNRAVTQALLALATRGAPPDEAPQDEPADAGAPDADGGL